MIKHTIFSKEECKTQSPDVPHPLFVCDCEWPVGRTHMMHDHKDSVEIVLITKGHMIHCIDHGRFFAQAGDLFLHNSNTVHDEQSDGQNIYQTLCLGITNLQLPELPANQLLAKYENPFFQQPAQYDELRYLFDRMLFHASQKRTFYQDICQNLTLASLSLVQQMICDRQKTSSPGDATLCEQVESYLDLHYAEHLSLELLGQLFHISPYHLSHIFKKETGYSLKHYILRRRIGEAQSLLSDTAMNIHTIAEQIGYEDAGYFSKLFYKYVGMRPSEYRTLRLKN